MRRLHSRNCGGGDDDREGREKKKKRRREKKKERGKKRGKGFPAGVFFLFFYEVLSRESYFLAVTSVSSESC